jgi:TetR/AcrR family transcriptional regulator, mexJK operon transcriptional repressor
MRKTGRPLLHRPTNRGGRPTQAEATRRHQHLVKIAGEMFMKLGFDGTSVEAVADAAGVSKRTVYARYRDKNDLFNAVLRNLIDRWLTPIHQFESGTSELEPMLVEIGHYLLSAALAPKAVSLHRIIIAESERRPQFGRLANADGRQQTVRAIAAAFRRHAKKLRVKDLERAAEHFLALVVDNNLWRAAMGLDLRTRSVDDTVQRAVDLFLNGALRSY